MRKSLLVAGLAVAALVPSLAFAQQTCEQQHGDQVAAAAAAVVGSEVSRPDRDCAHAYGYYDHNSQWHAMATDRADARGYYDRDGAWVDGAPNGYYDGGGRWVAGRGEASASGYYDGQGRWTPASANGYYDDRGQWVASSSGYYDSGHWVSGPTAGAYDADGHWMRGARSGHTDANGVWVADAQPGYYDGDHHWRAGPVRGYYDTQGVWIGAAVSAGGYGVDSGYQGAPRHDVDSREAWLDQRIQSAIGDAKLSGFDARADRRELDSIRHDEASMRDNQNGQLSPQNEAGLQGRLDQLSATLRQSLHGDGF